MKRIVAVITDPNTRTAKFGTVVLPPEISVEAGPPARVVKRPGENADPHHPDTPTLLTIDEGSHSIFVPAADGRAEIECRLGKGDQILFLDFKPECPPAANRRFCYSGHWSQPGPDGAVLLRTSITVIDSNTLGWIDGLPE